MEGARITKLKKKHNVILNAKIFLIEICLDFD